MEHLSSPLVFSEIDVARSLVFCAVFCKSLFVLLYFIFRPLCCLSFFNLQLLIIPLVSSNFSWLTTNNLIMWQLSTELRVIMWQLSTDLRVIMLQLSTDLRVIMLVIYWPEGNNVTVIYWPEGNNVTVIYWPEGNNVTVIYWPEGNNVTVIYWPEGNSLFLLYSHKLISMKQS
jgi:hypothetical protein